MDRLPDEVILQILSFLSVTDLVSSQSLARRHLRLGRDSTLWKTICFNHSRAEALRRRQQLQNAQDSRLAELRNAVSALPGGDLTAWDVSQLRGSAQPRSTSDPVAEARRQHSRALANWEPEYPGERLDYYEEYIHRHAPINIGWLNIPKPQSSDKEAVIEATGLGQITGDDGDVRNVVAPLDDGSICIWDVSARGTYASGGGGRKLAQSRPGLLSGQAPNATTESHAIMTETGAVECVAIDSNSKKGYFAIQNLLQEVDLSTLQLVSTKQYPFPITALSAAEPTTPVTVGTNMTIHLHDPRDPAFVGSATSNSGELIGGSIYSHATLAEPGPLSILHHNGLSNDDSSIWVAGRFTSLLNYDRRFFPRLRGTVHSGARIASLASIPRPYIPRSLDLLRNPDAAASARLYARSQPGTTLLAAAEYKGKGSLELYGLSQTPRQTSHYQNRQTASASKLLSAASHEGRIVFSDGDGNLKWVERDGFSHVRTFNVNDSRRGPEEPENSPASTAAAAAAGSPLNRAARSELAARGIWASSAEDALGQGDIVQKIIPTSVANSSMGISNSPTSHDNSSNGGRKDLSHSNLLLWTGDGAIGVLGFGHRNPLETNGDDEWHDAVESIAETVEQKAREDAERQYAGAMRRALERNADEVRFVRGLGMGFMRQ